MTDFPWPTDLAPFEVTYYLQPHTGGSESPFSRVTKVYGLSAPRWIASLAFRGGYDGASGAGAFGPRVEAMLARLEGRMHRAELWDWRRRTMRGPGWSIAASNEAALEGATSMVLTGFAAGAEKVVLEGDMIGGDGRPHLITDDADADAGGRATVSFKPPLAADVAAGAAVFGGAVTGLFRQTGDDAAAAPVAVGGAAGYRVDFVEDTSQGLASVPARPAITGAPIVGQQLTASGSWHSRQWYRDEAAIAGAAAASYTLTSADEDAEIAFGGGHAGGIVWSLPTLPILTDDLPYAFVADGYLAENVGATQSAIVNRDGTRFFASGNVTGPGDQSGVAEYDADGNELWSADFNTLLPSWSEQANGLDLVEDDPDYPGGKLRVGFNNYNGEPKRGGVFEIDASDGGFIGSWELEPHWHEGGGTRPGTDDYFAVNIDSHTIDRHDMSSGTPALVASYDSGAAHGGTSVYQDLHWLRPDVAMCPVHADQSQPGLIDVLKWTGAGFHLLYRMERPTAFATQGFGLDYRGESGLFAERDGGGAGVHNILKVTTLKSPFIRETPDPAAAALADCIRWFNGFDTSGGVSAYNLHEQIGDTDHAANSAVLVYPMFDADGRFVRFDGGSGSFVEVGAILPAGGLTEWAVPFRIMVIETTAGRIVIQGNASGSNIGDWQIVTNQAGADSGTLQLAGTNPGLTTTRAITTDPGALPNGVWNDVVFTGEAARTRCYVNKTLVKEIAFPIQIGGASQVHRFGADITGSTAGQMNLRRDFRIYDRAWDQAEVDAFTDDPGAVWLDG